MEFVNPLFLYGLAAIAIPIVIHLFNFRRFRKVYFTNVRFLEELQQKTQKQSQIRHLLALLMRILAIASLALAFAQPYIPTSDASMKQQARNAVSIYIDNSFSMGLTSSQGALLDEALGKAREVAMAYGTTDVFQLLTNDFQGVHQRFVNRQEFLQLLDEVEISPARKMISEVMHRQADLFHENRYESRIACLISDFQKNITDVDQIKPDTTINGFLIPVEAIEKSNLYIDSAWFDAPAFRLGQLIKLNVKIKSASDQDFEKVPVKLTINGQQRAITSFDLNAGKEIELELPFTIYESGIQYGTLEITDFPITYDDLLYFTFDVKELIPILAINADEESLYLNSLFQNDSSFFFQNEAENRLDYSSFSRYNLIILNGLNKISSGLTIELNKFAETGGSIAIFPGEEADLDSYRQLFISLNTSFLADKITSDTRVAGINTLSSIYDDVFESVQENIDLPKVTSYYLIRRPTGSMMENQLDLLNGDIFMGSEPAVNGMLYLFAVPLNHEWSNFVKHAMFVPTLYKIGLLSQGASVIYHTAGENERITINKSQSVGDQIFKIRSTNKDFEVIPEIRSLFSQTEIFTQNQIKEAGHYKVVYNDETLAGLAFNYNRKESDLDFYSRADLAKMVTDRGLTHFQVIKPTDKSLTEVIDELSAGIKLTKLFISLALAFLLGEILLLRFLK
ncbi:MAG: BatA domain-containing protein [Bacteroidales bacterium]|jgi:hypothetical protein|nr:BatA domain-containing protein [Bacteroidales bacterium]MDI9591678.1 BatA domain-containing protein [Bacteroidota bacterium]NLH33269.1 hypothetical protein [Lentimicrobium sp.]HNV50845.1 BatA domain-containing protein [Bacteroidales bacterium]HOG67410.1 BatA domain-containing protein [Bacteroidales bacterium]